MTHKDKGHFEIEDPGAVLIVRADGGPHALFGLEIANELEEFVDRVATTTQTSMPSSSLGASHAVHQPCCGIRLGLRSARHG